MWAPFGSMANKLAEQGSRMTGENQEVGGRREGGGTCSEITCVPGRKRCTITAPELESPVNVSGCESLLLATGFPLASSAAAPLGESPSFRGSGVRGTAEGYPTPVL